MMSKGRLFSELELDQLLDLFREVVREEVDNKINPKPVERFLSREQAAKELQITLSTLHHHTKSGRLKAHRLGSRVLYKESEILKAVEGL